MPATISTSRAVAFRHLDGWQHSSNPRRFPAFEGYVQPVERGEFDRITLVKIPREKGGCVILRVFFNEIDQAPSRHLMQAGAMIDSENKKRQVISDISPEDALYFDVLLECHLGVPVFSSKVLNAHRHDFSDEQFTSTTSQIGMTYPSTLHKLCVWLGSK